MCPRLLEEDQPLLFFLAALSCAIVGPGGSDSVNSTIRSRTVWLLNRAHIDVSIAILSGFSIIPRAAVSCLANPIVTTWPSTPTNRPLSRKAAILEEALATSSWTCSQLSITATRPSSIGRVAIGIKSFTSPAAPGGRAVGELAERPCGGDVFPTTEDLDGIGTVAIVAVD